MHTKLFYSDPIIYLLGKFIGIILVLGGIIVVINYSFSIEFFAYLLFATFVICVPAVYLAFKFSNSQNEYLAIAQLDDLKNQITIENTKVGEIIFSYQLFDNNDTERLVKKIISTINTKNYHLIRNYKSLDNLVIITMKKKND